MADLEAGDDNPAGLRPTPCRYCAIEHGNCYFPDLMAPVLEERFTYMAMVKKTLCATVAGVIPHCDPGICEQGLTGATTRPALINACRDLWRHYYGTTFYGDSSGVEPSAAFDALLDELGYR